MGVLLGSRGHKTSAGRRRIDESPRPGPLAGKNQLEGKMSVEEQRKQTTRFSPLFAPWQCCGKKPPLLWWGRPCLALVGDGVGVVAPAAAHFGVLWPGVVVVHFVPAWLWQRGQVYRCVMRVWPVGVMAPYRMWLMASRTCC